MLVNEAGSAACLYEVAMLTTAKFVPFYYYVVSGRTKLVYLDETGKEHSGLRHGRLVGDASVPLGLQCAGKV